MPGDPEQVAGDGDRHVLFVGVEPQGSRALAAVPEWSRWLGHPLRVRPVDVPPGAGPDAYRRIVLELLLDPDAAGAVITGHKVAMYAAAVDRCRYVSSEAQRLRECSVLASRPDGLAAYATDVRSVGAAVDRIWPASAAATSDTSDTSDTSAGTAGTAGGAPVACLGAGGSAAALCLHLLRRRPPPPAVVVCERDPHRAAEFLDLFGAPGRVPEGVDLRVETGPGPWDGVVASLPPGALVVNATGLGKADERSPLTSAAVFPRDATVWDLNYRGPLPFLALARAQAERSRLDVHDGWRLFVLGWLAALSALLDVDPPAGAEDTFLAIAVQSA